MDGDAWAPYRSALLGLSAVELVMILVSLVGGVLYLARARSWQLLAYQVVLLPLLAAYACYLSVQNDLSGGVLVQAYHGALVSTSQIVVVLGLIHRKALAWAFLGRPDHPPGVRPIRWGDVGFMAANTALCFAVLMYLFGMARNVVSQAPQAM